SERDWSITGRSGKGFRAGSSMRRSDYATFMLTYLYRNGKLMSSYIFNSNDGLPKNREMPTK
ncbi:hypothetical protein Q4R04_19865, partial [Morganella morganii]